MKFALIGDNKTEAIKGAKGICPSCGSELIAKCGEIKMNHWSHKATRNCDPWWENETQWHRSWKNHFSVEWQENILYDERTNEKHIADIRTFDDLVIEFQHSHIDPKERNTRESFYKNMVWVIDGTRLKRDYPRFLKQKNNFRETNIPQIFFVDYTEECFPVAWLGSSKPVIFDFRGSDSINNPKDIRNNLYCLFPTRVGRYAVLAEITRKAFVKAINNGEWLTRAANFMNHLIQKEQELQNQRVKQQRLQDSLTFQRFANRKKRRLF